MAITADKVVVELQAKTEAYDAKIANSTSQFEARLAKLSAAAERAGKATSLIGVNQNFDKFAPRLDQAASGLKRVGSEGTNAEQSMRNLAFQFQDIGTMMASGQSPFILLAQQLPQITMYGGSLNGVMGALRTTFAGLLSPLGLATTAFVLLGSAAISYFGDLISGSEKGSKEIDEHAKLIRQVADRWGDAVPALKAYSAAIDELADKAKLLEAANAIAVEKLAPLAPTVADLRAEVAAAATDFNALGASTQDVQTLQNAIVELQKKTANGTATADDYRKVQDLLANMMKETTSPAIEALSVSLNANATAFNTAANSASKYRQEAAAAANIQLGPLGGLSPLTSGGGQFLNPDQLNTFNAQQDQYRIAGESAAAAMIKGFEGFVAKAKWDVNAFRAGFGSDTITKANGEIQRVTADTVVTLADAQRDLERRLVDFQDGIQKAIGIDTWNSLNEGQQAALTSIAYNYGSLPDRIVKAIKAGGGPEAVATAINALGADNKGINKNRRNKEAQEFLSGTGISLSNKQSPEDLFAGDMEQIQQRIDLLNKEAEARNYAAAGFNDYGFAVEQARIKQQLLNDAKRAGLTITPELSSKIDQLATNYAKAATQSEVLAAKQKAAADAVKNATEVQKQWSDLATTAINGIANALEDGKITAQEWLQIGLQIIRQLSQMKTIAGGIGGGGFGGLLGGFLIPGILHDGGVAGADGYGHSRAVSPRVFAGAQRFHNGTMGAGLLPGEVPAILQRGEVVLPHGAGVGGGQSVVINAPINAPGADAAALARVERSVNELGKNIPKMVDQRVDTRQARKTRA